jgi:hypothetical protein
MNFVDRAYDNCDRLEHDPESGYRFSENIMLTQKDNVRV